MHNSFYCTLLHFTDTALLQIEDLWQPCVGQVYWHHFSNSIYSLHVFETQLGNSHSISKCFIIVIFLWSSVMSNLWCYYCNYFGHHKPCSYKTENLINVVPALSTPLIISLPLLRPTCSLRHNNTEIRLVNSL